MDESSREQTELLRHIWNEMKALGTNLGGRIDALRVELKEELRSEIGALRTELKAGIGQTNARLDQTNAKLDHTNERLDTVDTTLQELAAQQVMLGRYVKHTSQRAIDELRARVSRIEGVLKLE